MSASPVMARWPFELRVGRSRPVSMTRNSGALVGGLAEVGGGTGGLRASMMVAFCLPGEAAGAGWGSFSSRNVSSLAFAAGRGWGGGTGAAGFAAGADAGAADFAWASAASCGRYTVVAAGFATAGISAT